MATIDSALTSLEHAQRRMHESFALISRSLAQKVETMVYSTPDAPEGSIYFVGDPANPNTWGAIRGLGKKGRCKMQSYQYELIRKAVTTNGPEGVEVVKDGAVIKTGSVLVQPNANPPTREGLLFEHHDEVAEAGGPDKVEVNIRPFCK